MEGWLLARVVGVGVVVTLLEAVIAVLVAWLGGSVVPAVAAGASVLELLECANKLS